MEERLEKLEQQVGLLQKRNTYLLRLNILLSACLIVVVSLGARNISPDEALISTQWLRILDQEGNAHIEMAYDPKLKGPYIRMRSKDGGAYVTISVSDNKKPSIEVAGGSANPSTAYMTVTEDKKAIVGASGYGGLASMIGKHDEAIVSAHAGMRFARLAANSSGAAELSLEHIQQSEVQVRTNGSQPRILLKRKGGEIVFQAPSEKAKE